MIKFFILLFLSAAAFDGYNDHWVPATTAASLALFMYYEDRRMIKDTTDYYKHPKSACKPEPTEQLLSEREAESSNSHSDFRYWPEKFNSELES